MKKKNKKVKGWAVVREEALFYSEDDGLFPFAIFDSEYEAKLKLKQVSKAKVIPITITLQ